MLRRIKSEIDLGIPLKTKTLINIKLAKFQKMNYHSLIDSNHAILTVRKKLLRSFFFLRSVFRKYVFEIDSQK